MNRLSGQCKPVDPVKRTGRRGEGSVWVSVRSFTRRVSSYTVLSNSQTEKGRLYSGTTVLSQEMSKSLLDYYLATKLKGPFYSMENGSLRGVLGSFSVLIEEVLVREHLGD